MHLYTYILCFFIYPIIPCFCTFLSLVPHLYFRFIFSFHQFLFRHLIVVPKPTQNGLNLQYVSILILILILPSISIEFIPILCISNNIHASLLHIIVDLIKFLITSVFDLHFDISLQLRNAVFIILYISFLFLYHTIIIPKNSTLAYPIEALC